MKTRITSKALRESSKKIVSINYCGAQFLLSNHTPFAYNAGVYGWNYDVYKVGQTYIVTGYRPIKGIVYSNTREYEKKAQNIINNHHVTYEEKRERIENLLHEYLNQ